MDSSELYNRFRADVTDTAKPYLWSEDEVWAYMNDAYMMYFRLMGGVADATSAVTQVSVVAGEPYADIDPSILMIRHAHRVSDSRAISVINFEDVNSTIQYDYGVAAPMRINEEPGVVSAVIIGMEEDKVRWLKVPEVDDTIQLYVYRLPLDPIVGDGQEFVDLKERHHLHLLDWMKAKAYAKQDAETLNVTKSREHEDKFREYCRQAKAEWDRYRHKPRTVMYGGI